ncbi:MAG TPA: hypothetical protein VH184_21575, partial [Dongiaceae bacterium]|nr:hypothetical protein [Dongiaceae bacterium]
MSEPEKKTDVKNEPSLQPEIELTPEPLTANSQIAKYLKRKAEVTEQDHRELQVYLEEKARQLAPVAPPPPNKKFSLSRRNALKIVAGTAIAGEAAALGYSAMTGSNGKSAGAATGYGAQKQGIRREMTDSAADIGDRSLGRWVALLPTKMGGGTYAIDLHSNRVLSSVWYWNYGDYNPISHHLCAFPSADPYRSFEFVNSTQGGKNCLIYDIDTKIKVPAPGFNIYRVRYDGARMAVMENVAETTGLGLGVHVTINPADAQSYFVTDGQKDIAACFDRTTSRVIVALKFDWAGNSPNLPECWLKGGTLTISKIYPDPATGKFDYEGTKGQKIEWEMVPMGEYLVEENQIPGDSPHTLSGADGTIWHPSGRWAATVVRLCGGIAILDKERNFEPAAFLQFNKDAPGQYPVTRIDDDHWQVVFDKIASPGHEIGFSPDGNFLCMMNN